MLSGTVRRVLSEMVRRAPSGTAKVPCAAGDGGRGQIWCYYDEKTRQHFIAAGGDHQTSRVFAPPDYGTLLIYGFMVSRPARAAKAYPILPLASNVDGEHPELGPPLTFLEWEEQLAIRGEPRALVPVQFGSGGAASGASGSNPGQQQYQEMVRRVARANARGASSPPSDGDSSRTCQPTLRRS